MEEYRPAQWSNHLIRKKSGMDRLHRYSAKNRRPSENGIPVFRRPRFKPMLSAASARIAQPLRHTVDGQMHHQQQVRIVRVFAQAFEHGDL